MENNNQENQKRSPLESLQEKIYRPESEMSERPEAPEEFRPKESVLQIPTTDWEAQKNEEFMTVKKYKKQKLLSRLIGIIVFSAVVALGFLGYIYFFRTFKASDVYVKIKGPETVESGENIQFFVSYQNSSKFDLNDAVLIFEWPKGAAPKDSGSLKIEKRIGTITSGREMTISFEGQLFGAKNDKLPVNAVLKYVPKDQTKTYESKGTFEPIISKTPFSVIMNMPPRAVSGNEIDLTLEYQNLSDTEFSSMQLKMEYPEGFTFTSADPAPSSNNSVWDFKKIGGKEIGRIKIKGILNGRDNETKLFQSFIGKSENNQFTSYSTSQVSSVMSSTILFVYQTVNDSRELSASPESILTYKIKYRNTSDVAVPNVVVYAKLDSKVVDYKSFDIKWGSFSGATNSIIWNASGVPQLALLGPGEEGEVSFTVRVNKTISVSGVNDKNFVISSVASISSDQVPDALRGIPIGNEDKVDVKLNTALSLATVGLYQNSPIDNTGPIPPKVGQKTTYNIIWQLTNTSNDIDNARIEASLPPSATWEGRISPSSANVAYERSTGKIIWNIGKIPAGTGFVMPALQLAFQVSVTPGFADIGKAIDLISETDFIGTDSFTTAVISKRSDKKDTYLLEDPYVIEKKGWEVVQ